MENQQLAFWVDIISSLIAVIGLFVVAYELHKSRMAEIRQFHFETFKIFSIDLRQDRLVESRLLGVDSGNWPQMFVSEPELFHSVKNILDFYTLISAAARDKTINRDKAVEYWGQTIISYWNRYGHFFEEQKKLFGPESYADLEWFRDLATAKYPNFETTNQRMRVWARELIDKNVPDDET